MVFNSIQFALFLPIVFVMYWLLRKNMRLQNLFVVLASYVFYGWWDWRFLILIAFTSFCSWGSGLLIHRTPSTVHPTPYPVPHTPESRTPYTVHHTLSPKFWLIANVVLNLGILGVFKYYDFFVTSFAGMLGVDASRHLLNVILPVGISFYTFQALSYSIDVYRGKIEPTRDPIAFFAYVAFFPQLVAGPIERATNLLPQFQKARTFDYAEAVEGCRHILWGLFKKMVIADNCAIYVDSVWKDYASQSGSTLLLAAVLFAFQIYGDFSGYSDIAIGTAKLFGINLRDNFLTPYFSRNVAEFWKRWHISLNTWFVDYVYIPLGGSRPTIADCWFINKSKKHKKNTESSVIENDLNGLTPQSACMQASRQTDDSSRSADIVSQSLPNDSVQKMPKNPENASWKQWVVIRNTFVIFLLSGLWHGANWTYVGWGAYHALLFVPLIWLGTTKKYRDIATWKQVPQMVLTFALVVLGWIIFRAPSIADAWQYVAAMADKSLLSVPWLMTRDFYLPLFASIGILLLFEWIGRKEGYGLGWLRNKRGAIQLLVYYLFMVLIYVWQSSEDIQFIYFQF